MSLDNAEPRPPEESNVVRTALKRFVIRSIIAVLLLAGVSVHAADRLARTQALRHATAQTQNLAGFVAGLVTPELRAGAPGSTDELQDLIEPRLGEGDLRHVKIWSADGVVLYSDQDRVIGRTFELPGDVRELLGTTEAVAEVSDVDRDENVGERASGRLLEVYVGTEDGTGQPIVFEAYLATTQLEESRQSLLIGLVSLMVGGLLLFQIAVLPLALALARRVERGEKEHSRLTRHALLASDLERRRIAQDLHDGVIQDLAGLAYALPLVEGDDAGARRPGPRLSLDRAHQVLLDSVTALRRLITDSYPPDLESAGLSNAIAELAGSTQSEALEISVDVSANGSLSGPTARLAYRVVREGLRNVTRHAHAQQAVVRVHDEGSHVRVEVEDDGIGLPPGGAPEGHVGLRLLIDTISDVGGSVQVTPAPMGGTLLEARFPVDMV